MEEGVQLTWMDAMVENWVVTPRAGKPVEVNALWYNALRFVENALRERNDKRAATYAAMAGHVQESFRARFMSDEYEQLADVVDGPDGDDWSLRPNQIFAVSLPYPLLEGDRARSIVRLLGRSLLTTSGLRTLDPETRNTLACAPEPCEARQLIPSRHGLAVVDRSLFRRGGRNWC